MKQPTTRWTNSRTIQRRSKSGRMEPRQLLSLPWHCVKLFYGVAAVGLAGVLSLTANGAAEGQRPVTTVSQPPIARDVVSNVTAHRPSSFIVLVASEEQASRIRSDLGTIHDDYGLGYVDAPLTFVVARTPQEADVARQGPKDDFTFIDLTLQH